MVRTDFDRDGDTMTEPDLWLLAATVMAAPHISKSTGLFYAVVYFGIAIYLRHFA